MKIDTTFNIGDLVYITTDSDQRERLIVKVEVSVGGYMYLVACGTENSWHYEFEMSINKDFCKI